MLIPLSYRARMYFFMPPEFAPVDGGFVVTGAKPQNTKILEDSKMSAGTKKILQSVALIVAVIAIDKQLGVSQWIAVKIPGGKV